MFGYEYEDNYSHSLFSFFLIGVIVVIFFGVAFFMTWYMQDSSLAISGQLLG
ncbi:hypothetical protein HYY69_05655 [Candidatus Woesearchaeota archaeon]|nr:hypothetical protein [Candidatus Woesearchaeota archaeon]